MDQTSSLCPLCKKYPSSAENGVRPFCSQRCKEIDLAKWLSGEYRIPVAGPFNVEEEVVETSSEENDDA